MSDQTFLPSVSTFLSKDSVPVAVVTSVLDFVPFPKNDVNPKSWTQQKREVYIDIIETFFTNSHLNIAYLPYKMIEVQNEVAWATYDKNIVCLCGDPTFFKNYMLAHEILHTLGLRHSFFEQEEESNIYKKIMYEQGKTENLMDYKGDKYSTFKWQWEQIYENYKNK